MSAIQTTNRLPSMAFVHSRTGLLTAIATGADALGVLRDMKLPPAVTHLRATDLGDHDHFTLVALAIQGIDSVQLHRALLPLYLWCRTGIESRYSKDWQLTDCRTGMVCDIDETWDENAQGPRLFLDPMTSVGDLGSLDMITSSGWRFSSDVDGVATATELLAHPLNPYVAAAPGASWMFFRVRREWQAMTVEDMWVTTFALLTGVCLLVDQSDLRKAGLGIATVDEPGTIIDGGRPLAVDAWEAMVGDGRMYTHGLNGTEE